MKEYMQSARDVLSQKQVDPDKGLTAASNKVFHNGQIRKIRGFFRQFVKSYFFQINHTDIIPSNDNILTNFYKIINIFSKFTISYKYIQRLL